MKERLDARPLRRICCLLGFPLALVAAGTCLSARSSRAASPATPTPVARLHLPRGFIDDPFALSPDGRRLYYVATDGATFAELRVAELPPPNPATPAAPTNGDTGDLRTVATVTGLPIEESRMFLLPEGRVLMVTRNAQSGLASGVVYEFKGTGGGVRHKLGPAQDIVLGTAAGSPVIVALWRPPIALPGTPAGAAQGGKKPSGEYRVQVVHAGTLKPLGGHSFRLSNARNDGRNQGTISAGPGQPGQPVTPLYVIDDDLTLVGRQGGEFDKKSDLRQPDRLVYLDLLTGKLRPGGTLADPAALAEVAQLHDKHSGESLFADFDSAQRSAAPSIDSAQRSAAPSIDSAQRSAAPSIDSAQRSAAPSIDSAQRSAAPSIDADNAHLQMVRAQPGTGGVVGPTGPDQRKDVQMPRKLSLYDPATLRYQADPAAGTIVFSLTVDPVNQDAVARKKADADPIDLCEFNFASGQVRRLIELPGKRRPSAWALARTAPTTSRLALLRKHTGFSRGGSDLEIYDIYDIYDVHDISHK